MIKGSTALYPDSGLSFFATWTSDQLKLIEYYHTCLFYVDIIKKQYNTRTYGKKANQVHVENFQKATRTIRKDNKGGLAYAYNINSYNIYSFHAVYNRFQELFRRNLSGK